VLRVLYDVGVQERADHDAVHIAGQVAGGVLDWLASADLQVVGREEQCRAAELVHPDLERHAGARRRFREDHGEGFAGELVVRDAVFLLVLELRGEVEYVVYLLGR
jgi:hypothetical protein